jgi:3D (Asp-Asp-Asp) domain-containing protein
MFIQIGVAAQNPAQSSQDKSVKSSNTSSSSAHSDISNQLALAADSGADKAKSEVTADASKETAIPGPRVELKSPSIDLKIIARESKMSERSFVGPDLETMGEPRTFHATAYALYGRTRTGVWVRRGVIAADPRVLPLGSIVQLKAGKYSGVYTVQDTGRKIKGNIVDVWMPSNREARQFGRRRIQVHVLRYGPQGRVKTR